MVIILGRITFESVEECARLHTLLGGRASRSREDAGSITYTFAQNIEDPTEICLTETWESEQALNEHLQIPDPEFYGALESAKIVQARVVAYDGGGERVLMSRGE